MKIPTLLFALLTCPGLAGCGDDSSADADRLGVGASCKADADCEQSPFEQVCLLQFKGGYCGVLDCQKKDDCPSPSACVAHDDGNNYCFRTCSDKLECNVNRTPENESNCVSNVTHVEADKETSKACVPPSSGEE
jgi:hypothetical protein